MNRIYYTAITFSCLPWIAGFLLFALPLYGQDRLHAKNARPGSGPDRAATWTVKISGKISKEDRLRIATWAENYLLSYSEIIPDRIPPLLIRIAPEISKDPLSLDGQLVIPTPSSITNWKVRTALQSHILSTAVTLRSAGNSACFQLPQWLILGLARLFTQDTVSSDTRLAIDYASISSLPEIEDIVQWSELSVAPSPLHCIASSFCAWILSLPDGHRVLFRIVDHLARHGRLDPEAFADYCAFPSLDAANASWRAWLVDQERFIIPGVSPPRVALAKLVDALRVSSAHWEAIGRTKGVNTPSIADWLRYSNEPWGQRLSLLQCKSIRKVGIGQSRDIAELSNAYCLFYEHIAKQSSARKCRSLWIKAENQRLVVEDLFHKRTRYIDTLVDENDGLPRPPFSAQHLLDKSEMHEYVDRIEKEDETH